MGRVSCPLTSCFPKVKTITLCQLCQPTVSLPAGTEECPQPAHLGLNNSLSKRGSPRHAVHMGGRARW